MCELAPHIFGETVLGHYFLRVKIEFSDGKFCPKFNYVVRFGLKSSMLIFVRPKIFDLYFALLKWEKKFICKYTTIAYTLVCHVFCIFLQRPLIEDRDNLHMYTSVLVDGKKLYQAEQKAVSKGPTGGPAILLNAVIGLVFMQEELASSSSLGITTAKKKKVDNCKPLNKVAVDTIRGKVLHIDKNIKEGGVLQNC